jgi:hypothetical protein
VAVTAYFQPKFQFNHLGKATANLSTDTFVVGLIASGTLAARSVSEGYEFVSDLLANNGSALTEVSTSGTNYARQNLASVSYTISGLVVTFTAANPNWNSATFNTSYGWIHDETASSGTDATRALLCVWDFGGSQSVSGVPFTLTVNASGLVTWAAAQ